MAYRRRQRPQRCSATSASNIESGRAAGSCWEQFAHQPVRYERQAQIASFRRSGGGSTTSVEHSHTEGNRLGGNVIYGNSGGKPRPQVLNWSFERERDGRTSPRDRRYRLTNGVCAGERHLGFPSWFPQAKRHSLWRRQFEALQRRPRTLNNQGFDRPKTYRAEEQKSRWGIPRSGAHRHHQ